MLLPFERRVIFRRRTLHFSSAIFWPVSKGVNQVKDPFVAVVIVVAVGHVVAVDVDVEGSDVVGTLLALGYNFDAKVWLSVTGLIQ